MPKERVTSASTDTTGNRPPRRVPLLPEWHAAWVEGDRMMPLATPNTIHLGLAVLLSVRNEGQTVRRLIESDFDDAQMEIEKSDAIKLHNRFGTPFKPEGHAGPGETAYNARAKAAVVLSGTKANIISTLFEFSLGEEGENRRHEPEDVIADVEAFLADRDTIDKTITLFEAAKRALHTPVVNRARGAFLRSMNLKLTGRPSEPVTVEQKTLFLKAAVPIFVEHIFSAGRELEISDQRLGTFTKNVINPNFKGEPEKIEIPI